MVGSKAVPDFLPRPVGQLCRQEVAQPVRHLGATSGRLLVDSQLRHPDDRLSIGLVLCKTRNRVIAEYVLRDISKPIGVAEWKTKIVHSLQEPLRSNLPTIEQIEEELSSSDSPQTKGES